MTGSPPNPTPNGKTLPAGPGEPVPPAPAAPTGFSAHGRMAAFWEMPSHLRPVLAIYLATLSVHVRSLAFKGLLNCGHAPERASQMLTELARAWQLPVLGSLTGLTALLFLLRRLVAVPAGHPVAAALSLSGAVFLMVTVALAARYFTITRSPHENRPSTEDETQPAPEPHEHS